MPPDRLALGIIQLANLEVAKTVRRQTLERGNDPREYTILASGGGGPLHSPAIAREVGIRQVLVPRFPGHYSALGMLEANLRMNRREVLVGSLTGLEHKQLQQVVDRISGELSAELTDSDPAAAGHITVNFALAVRFKGQEHALWIPSGTPGTLVSPDIAIRTKEAFEAEYVHRYGHIDEISPIETAELEVIAERALPPVTTNYDQVPDDGTAATVRSLWSQQAGWTETPVLPRTRLGPGDKVEGPTIIHEIGSTTVIPPDATADVLEDGVLLITFGG